MRAEWEWGKTSGEHDCEASEASLAAVPGAKTADTRATREEEAERRASADSKDACSNLKPAGAPSVFRPWASVFQGRSSRAQRASHTPAPTWPTCKLSPGMVSRRLVVVS